MIKYTFERRCIFSMASKGQRFSSYTKEEKNEIIQRYLNGESGYQLSKQYGIPVGKIKTWKTKIDHPEKITFKQRGRPKEKDLTKEDYKERFEILKKYQAFLKAQREKNNFY